MEGGVCEQFSFSFVFRISFYTHHFCSLWDNRRAKYRVKPHHPPSWRPLLDTDQQETYPADFIPAFLTWQQSLMTKGMTLSGQTWASY